MNGAQAAAYWRMPFRPVLSSRQLSEYVVLDVEASGIASQRFVEADVQVWAVAIPALRPCCWVVISLTAVDKLFLLHASASEPQIPVCLSSAQDFLNWLLQSLSDLK